MIFPLYIIFALYLQEEKKKSMIILFLYTAGMLWADAAYFFVCNLLQKVVFVVLQEAETAQTPWCRPKQKPTLQWSAQSSTASWVWAGISSISSHHWRYESLTRLLLHSKDVTSLSLSYWVEKGPFFHHS